MLRCGNANVNDTFAHANAQTSRTTGFCQVSICVSGTPQMKRGSPQRLDGEINHRLYSEGPWYWSVLAYSYGRAGQLERARLELEKLEKMSRHGQVGPVTMLWAHRGRGNKEEALADLEKAYSEHFGMLTTPEVEPAFDPLRGDPRFQDLLRRAGLADTNTTGK